MLLGVECCHSFVIVVVEQMLSPLSEGLFHRAIAESGTAAMSILAQDDPQPVLQVNRFLDVQW